MSLPTGLLSLNSHFPSIYDINGCATTAVYLVSGWVLLCDHGLDFFRSTYVLIQSIKIKEYKFDGHMKQAGVRKCDPVPGFKPNSYGQISAAYRNKIV